MDNNLLHRFLDNIRRCNCDKIHMVPSAFMHAIIGMGDEMGELMEILKRALYYGDKIDDDHLIEEYGDIMFYIMLDCMRISEGDTILTPIGIFEQILNNNIHKLKQRYPQGFSEEKATESGRNLDAEKATMKKVVELDPRLYKPDRSTINQPELEDLGRGVKNRGKETIQSPQSTRSNL